MKSPNRMLVTLCGSARPAARPRAPSQPSAVGRPSPWGRRAQATSAPGGQDEVMIEAWSVADVRAAEEPLLAAGVPLMERASFALATVVARDLARRRSVALPDGGRRDGRVTGARAVLLVGSGNNGGDTLHAGAYLARRGVEVLAVLAGEHAHPGGLAALRAAGGTVEVLVGSPEDVARADRPHDRLDPHVADRVAVQVARADVVLDGLVGIGARGPLRGVAADLVRHVSDVLDAQERGRDAGSG